MRISARPILIAATFVVLAPAALAAQQTPAPAAPPAAKVEYVGAVTVFTDDAAALAGWYTRALGLAWPIQANGGFFGGMETAAGPVRMGVMPRSANPLARPGSSVAVVFRVSEFDAALARLKAAQPANLMERQDEEGRFAFFTDPDGNSIAIWGK